MGLSTSMTTALTGLHAAETQIDVAGNNLANSQTVGFKASDVIFATQFLRTLSHGSAPTPNDGGTNPRQLGLGVQVAAINPDFSQGSIQISNSPSDLALQGDGFFIVEGLQSEHLYTRNGIFNTNADNELVASTGNRLLGYGVDDDYILQTTQLVPLTIPLGSDAAAEPTQNVFLTGNLTPTGDLSTAAEVIESNPLGDGTYPQPDVNDPTNPTSATVAPFPDAAGAGTGAASGGSGSTFNAGEQYEYAFTFVDGTGTETMPSQSAVGSTVGANGENLTLSNLPPSPTVGGSPEYANLNIYRRQLGLPAGDPAGDYRLIGNAAQGAAAFVDSGLPTGTQLDSTGLNGTYSYMVTFSGPGVAESRPSDLVGPVSPPDGRVHLDNMPSIPAGSGYDTINVYRNLATNSGQYYLVTSLSPGQDYTDSRTDAQISDPTDPAYRELNVTGPGITDATLLTNVVQHNGVTFEQVFPEGQLTYTGRKGGNTLTEKTFDISNQTTVGEFRQFLAAASGIQSATATDAIPDSANVIPGETGTLSPGGLVSSDGRLRLVSNNGTANAVDIPASGFQLTKTDGTTITPNLGFTSAQSAVGESASSNFLAYDSLGVPLDVRLTTVLESRDGDSATFRWFADTGDNDPTGPDNAIAVGTGLVTFDGQGNMIQADNSTVTVQRQDMPSNSPLTFDFDFSQLTGFANDNSTLAATRQDGSAFGSLTSYSIGENGEITGVFSNGVTRTLGQVRLARFTNPVGLDQMGENMFGQSFNSGLPVEGNPGEMGLGTIVAGAVESSNTDTGANLIDLLLASTQYRANSRVISTSQQLLDELLNLRR